MIAMMYIIQVMITSTTSMLVISAFIQMATYIKSVKILDSRECSNAINRPDHGKRTTKRTDRKRNEIQHIRYCQNKCHCYSRLSKRRNRHAKRYSKRAGLVSSAVSVWLINIWISKSMFLHHMI